MENNFTFDWCGNTERLTSSSRDKKDMQALDSPRKNKIMEVMNEENQKLVQNEIY